VSACTIEERPASVKKKISGAGFPNVFGLCIIRAPHGGLHFGAAAVGDEVRSTLSRGVDSLESRGKMCGSLQRNAFGRRAEAGSKSPSARCWRQQKPRYDGRLASEETTKHREAGAEATSEDLW